MQVQIFDVEHGACALLTFENGNRIMVDCGHNASTSWTPAKHLAAVQASELELLCITNYDEDHVSGLPGLLDSVFVAALSRNAGVSADHIKMLKTEDGMGKGIDRLVSAISGLFTVPAPATVFLGLDEWLTYGHAYPTFDDENNLSHVNFFKIKGVGILFPGDMERKGWLALLDRPGFKDVLRKTQILIAPHHGRESGCCDEIFEFCKPNWVIISDKGYMHSTQETVAYYRGKAKGGWAYGGAERWVLTTRSDGTISFNL